MKTEQIFQYSISCFVLNQGGKVLTSSSKSWEEKQFPISFPVEVSMHLATGLSASCGGVGITGSGAGHSDKSYFRLASENSSTYVRWLAMGY